MGTRRPPRRAEHSKPEAQPSRGSELLKEWRGDRSQEDACNLLDIDHGAYCAFETGYRRPGLERAVRICQNSDGAVPVAAWLEESKGNSKKVA